MADKYNLDEEDKFVSFIFQGNEYQLWYPTTEEVLKVENKKDDKAFEDFLIEHIRKPDGATYPDFKQVKNKLNVKQLAKFRQMINTELDING